MRQIWPNEGKDLTVEARSLRLFQKACAFLTHGTKIEIKGDSLNAMALIELLEGLDTEEVAKKVAQKTASLKEKKHIESQQSSNEFHSSRSRNDHRF